MRRPGLFSKDRLNGCFKKPPLMTLPMRAKFHAFLKDESAATAIEYGLIAAGISLAIIAVVSNLGTKLKSTFSSISTQLK
jgi:pilus assembly protein Flp/PilA